ncbi:MAG: hypothetical protein IT244_03250, partial [Bacteroidia bacterium]|nr:hypothetical protein [Bacteroidia bacterium]
MGNFKLCYKLQCHFKPKPTDPFMLRIFIAFTVFFLSITQLFATHMAGAELAYFNQGGGKYLLVAKIYRLCDGIPLNNPTGTVFVTNNAYNSCGSNNITFTRTAIQDVSFLCNSTSKCNPANTWTTGQGFEMHTFTATVDLAASPYAGYLSTSGCDVVTFTIAQCCRDINVTTFKSDNFIATATLYVGNLNNLSNKTNSSPTFVDLPVINYCCNIPITQFFEAKDSINKDILKYKLVNALNGINSPVNYYSPWSGEYPLTAYCPGGGIKCTPKPYKNIPEGIYLDSNTGEFIFTPIQCSEIGPVCVEVSEYRKSGNNLILVGNTRRDIIFKTIDCGQNKAPIIKSNNEYVLCTGDSSDIVIETLDTFKNNQGNLDTIDFKYKSDITKGTFNFDKNGRQPKLTLSWRPQSSDVRIEPYYIKITTIDQNCPFPGTSSKLIKLRVTNGNVNVATKAEIGKCNTVNISFTSSKSLTKSKMTWILTDSNKSDTIFNTSSNNFATPKLKKGKHYIFGKLESIDLCNSINTFD